MSTVALLRAEAGSAPSGTGSFSYFAHFQVVVDNLAFNKLVGIWGRDPLTATFGFHACTFSRSVPNNQEVWQATINTPHIDQFAVEYEVLGSIHWDNDGGHDYRLDTHAAESTDGVGTAILGPNVAVVSSGLDGAGNLIAELLVKNIAFQKQVAIVHTTDNWQTFQNAFGTFERTIPPAATPHQPNTELWRVVAPVGLNNHGQFAAFYTVQGSTFWDSNFTLNYAF
jgi:hypothetical protein